MSYIGSTPTTQSFIAGTDYFNGDGSTTAFTLSRSVVSTNDIQATVNNVVQQPNTAYTVSGTTITFTSAPSAGTGNIYVRYLSTTTQSITPSQGTVGNNQFANNISAIPMTYGTIGAGDASIMKNRIINGAMVIDQRNAGASVTVNANQYTLDRWQVFQSATGKYSVQQNAGSVTPPVGFQKYLGCTSLSSYSVSSGDYFFFQQVIEANNMQDLAWGTANAKAVTLSFQVYSSVTGTFSGSIENYSGNRSYPFTYTVSSANTWTTISVNIAGDTTGTWTATGNSGWGSVNFDLGSGSTVRGTANAWASGNYIGATGSASIIATSGATFYITGVQLEVGSSATGFEYVNYQTSLANCQRYYEKSYDAGVVPNTNAGYIGNMLFVGSSNGSSLFGYVTMQVPKRGSPTVTIYPPSGGTANTFDNGGTVGGSYIGYSGFGIYTSTLTGSRTTAQWIASAEL